MQYFDPISVGKRIKMVRKIREMRQIDIAMQLGYTSERQIQRIESGKSTCSIDKIVELSQILRISADYLLMGSEEKSSRNLEDELHNYLDSMTNMEQKFALVVLKSIFDNRQFLVNEISNRQ